MFSSFSRRFSKSVQTYFTSPGFSKYFAPKDQGFLQYKSRSSSSQGKSRSSSPRTNKSRSSSPRTNKSRSSSPESNKSISSSPRSNKSRFSSPRFNKSRFSSPRSNKSRSSSPQDNKPKIDLDERVGVHRSRLSEKIIIQRIAPQFSTKYLSNVPPPEYKFQIDGFLWGLNNDIIVNAVCTNTHHSVSVIFHVDLQVKKSTLSPEAFQALGLQLSPSMIKINGFDALMFSTESKVCVLGSNFFDLASAKVESSSDFVV